MNNSSKGTAERIDKWKERQKELNRARTKKCRELKKEQESQKVARDKNFTSRMAKKRCIDQVQNILPKTPEKKAEIITSLLNSPRTRKILSESGAILSEEEESTFKTCRAMLQDITSVVSDKKTKRNDDSRKLMNVGISLLCGESVKTQSLASKAASHLGVSRRRIAMAMQHRAAALSNAESAWTYTSRKTRSDAIDEEMKRTVYNFWCSPGVSRPTGNKKDVKRMRLGPNDYTTHEKQITEKTQTEIYNAFKVKYQDIKIGQRAFESLKPYFVIPARPQDRNSCCCRQHVEIRMIFNSCMNFRRSKTDGTAIIYGSLTELANGTLCSVSEPGGYYKKECLERTCGNCGMAKFVLHQQETSKDESTKVKWHRFEYVQMGDKRRLKLVEKETCPFEMFSYFQGLLRNFPMHRFRAQWQHEQLENLLTSLPLNHVVCIHDYSENFSCQYQDQIQTLYFSQTQASIHVTILHRHAVMELDGMESIAEEPTIITEHLFTISPDTKHDHHSVHGCIQNVVQYLKSINYNVTVMHEWTDGCACQYKSRHCLGDVSLSANDFGFPTIRNYFETSHAKGPQDGAGANLKHKADMAVIQRQTLIQNAKDLFTYAEENLKEPSSNRFQKQNVTLKRRVFFYVEEHDRNRPQRSFKEVPNIRKLHSVTAGSEEKKLKVRQLSCYCAKCLEEAYDECENKDRVDAWKEEDIVSEVADRRSTRSESNEELARLVDLISTNSTVAIASADPDEEYYLLKVKSDGAEVLPKSTTDGWGCRFPSNSSVLRGYFYTRHPCESGFAVFRLVNNKEAIVYAATARYICNPQDKEEEYHMLQDEHEDILFALQGF